LAALGWTVIDQGPGIPTDPANSLRTSFREVSLREVFNQTVRAINITDDGQPWLTDKLLFRSQVDANELTGEQYPNVKLIDFEYPERN